KRRQEPGTSSERSFLVPPELEGVYFQPLKRMRKPFPSICVTLLFGLLSAWSQEKITYQDHVLPLIENNCGKCHNPDKKKADLDLTTYSGVMKGSGSGQVVVSGNLEGSKLWRAITQVEEPTMPPNKPKLPDKELEV